MNLLRTLFTVSSLTLVSRILGYVRDFVIARAFGAGLATDAFFVAFRIPNLLRRLFAEGALSQAFVPVLAEQKNRTSLEEAKNLIDGVATLLGLALVVAAVLGIAAASLIVYLSAPGFAADPAKFDLTVVLAEAPEGLHDVEPDAPQAFHQAHGTREGGGLGPAHGRPLRYTPRAQSGKYLA